MSKTLSSSAIHNKPVDLNRSPTIQGEETADILARRASCSAKGIAELGADERNSRVDPCTTREISIRL